MNTKFKKAVDAGDLEGVRISLASEMMLDPRGVNFKEMRQYAEKAFANLYEIHDGFLFDQNRENWTEELLFATRNALDDNFSKERLDYYVEVAKVVLKDKADSLNNSTTTTYGYSTSTSTSTISRSQSSSYSEKCGFKMEPLSAALTIGGLLIGGTGLVLGRTIITVLGAASAAIGGYQLYNDNKK